MIFGYNEILQIYTQDIHTFIHIKIKGANALCIVHPMIERSFWETSNFELLVIIISLWALIYSKLNKGIRKNYFYIFKMAALLITERAIHMKFFSFFNFHLFGVQDFDQIVEIWNFFLKNPSKNRNVPQL